MRVPFWLRSILFEGVLSNIDVHSSDVSDAAAAWVARIDRGPLTEMERAQFEAWKSESSRHHGAFARAEAALALVMHVTSDRPQSDGVAHRPATFGRRAMLLGGTAGAMAASLAVIFWHHDMPTPEVLASRKGEVRLVPLSDHSVVTLNTHSSISVDYSGRDRHLELIDGEAVFRVAHDKGRAFVVTAGEVEVVAIGTEFLTRKIPGRPVEILVQEGVVDVLYKGDPRSTLRANANSRVTVSSSGGVSTLVRQTLDPTVLARESAWLTGMVSFEGVTLEEAVAELGRYSDMPIVVEAELQKKKITGLFSVHDPIRFSKAIAGSLGLRVEVRENEVRLLR